MLLHIERNGIEEIRWNALLSSTAGRRKGKKHAGECQRKDKRIVSLSRVRHDRSEEMCIMG